MILTLPQRITTAIVNYRTPDLLTTAVESFRVYYPDVPLIVLDNGSDAETVRVVENLVQRSGTAAKAIYLDTNVYHGPAMHRAISASDTPYVFVLDSDTETRTGGFLEEMLDAFEHEDVYAVGERFVVNKRGFASRRGKIPVAVSAYMVLDRMKYGKLPPFIHHSLPVLNNFAAAQRRGWIVEEFKIDEFVHHLGPGTAKHSEYGRGPQSWFDLLLNKIGL
ncbi:MAG: glycosyltransferase family 2 protein [Rhodothermales bacterium]|nr:glycosyltransferase family 2 protein [Rhodothermales bacterium]